MKKIVSVLLILALVFSLCACGGGLSKEGIQDAEKAGYKAGRMLTYKSYQDIQDVVVLYPKDEKTFTEALDASIEGLTYINKENDYSTVKGIVFEKYGSSFNAEDDFNIIYLIDADTEGDDFVKYSYETSTTTASTLASLSGGSIKVNEGTYILNKDKGVLGGVKWFLAQKSVEFDKWKTENADKLSAALDAEKSAKGDMDDKTWKASTAYHGLKDENSIYEKYASYTEMEAFLKTLVKELEKTDEAKYDAVYNKLLKQNQYETALGTMLASKAKYEKEIAKLKPAADTALAAHSATIESLKKSAGDNYKDTDDYLKIKASSTDIAKYEDQIAAIAVLDKGIEILDRMNATDSEIEMNYLDQLGDAENTYATTYYKARMEYINDVIALEKYESEHSADITAYEKGVADIKAKYKDKKGSYKDDVDYMKLEVKYKDVIDKVAKLKEEVKKSKDVCDEATKTVKEKRKTIEADIAKSGDIEKLNAFLKKANKEIVAIEKEIGEDSEVIGEIGGFYVVQMKKSVISSCDNGKKVQASTSSSSGGSYSGGSSSSYGKCKWADGCSKTATHGNFCKSHWDYLYGAYKDLGGSKSNPYDY